MPKYTYKAVQTHQTEDGDCLVLFGAPVSEIDTWAGVPQKKEIGTQETTETTGFQRELNDKRIKDLKQFYSNPKNIIQNPLLCSTRVNVEGGVIFIPENGNSSSVGTLEINYEPLENKRLVELLKALKNELEERIPEVKEKSPNDSLIATLKSRVVDEHGSEIADELEIDDEDGDEEPDEGYGEELFTDETHIYDFWEEVAARITILDEFGIDRDFDAFLGYSKEAVISFLKPVVLVDGQHRLKGATESLKVELNKEVYQQRIENAALEDKDPIIVQKEIEEEISRKLPISLLITSDPAEHVFQFIVVNQKATPIGKALLGTIVSTSLSNDELLRVNERLVNAGIQLEESRAAAFLTRYPSSPFYNKVEKGFRSDKDLLPWTVFVSLIKIFKDLKGGKHFHKRTDYADAWKRKCLNDSPIIGGWEDKGFNDPFSFWCSPDGPWRDVFISFWTLVKNIFSSDDERSEENYWGNPKDSNLFNKISLTILAADFFQYLHTQKTLIENATQIEGLVQDWLEGINNNYFNKNWDLSGVKKDSTGIRKTWSMLWEEYREDPQHLPDKRRYRIVMN